MTVSDWIALGGLAVLLIGGLIAHIRSDDKTQSDLKAANADLDNRVRRIEQEIGTHEIGIRGEMHRQIGLISRLRGVVYFIARKLNLDIMKDLDDDK